LFVIVSEGRGSAAVGACSRCRSGCDHLVVDFDAPEHAAPRFTASPNRFVDMWIRNLARPQRCRPPLA
jgi:hypothetical protein